MVSKISPYVKNQAQHIIDTINSCDAQFQYYCLTFPFHSPPEIKLILKGVSPKLVKFFGEIIKTARNVYGKQFSNLHWDFSIGKEYDQVMYFTLYGPPDGIEKIQKLDGLLELVSKKFYISEYNMEHNPPVEYKFRFWWD